MASAKNVACHQMKESLIIRHSGRKTAENLTGRLATESRDAVAQVSSGKELANIGKFLADVVRRLRCCIPLFYDEVITYRNAVNHRRKTIVVSVR